MKLCIIGNKNVFIKGQQENLNVDNLKNEITANKSKILESDTVLLQSDYEIDRTLKTLNNFFRQHNKITTILINLSLTDLSQSIQCTQKTIKSLASINVILIASISEDNNKQRWIIEICQEDDTKHKQLQESIDNLLHTMHYNIMIDHKNTRYVELGSFEFLSQYMKELDTIKKKYIEKIKTVDSLNIEAKLKLKNVIAKMVI